MVAFVPAADAMDDRHGLGRLAVLEQHLPAGRTAGIDETLEFECGEHVGQFAVVQLGDAGWVEILEAGRQDDRAHLQVEVLVGHVVVDGAAFTG